MTRLVYVMLFSFPKFKPMLIAKNDIVTLFFIFPYFYIHVLFYYDFSLSWIFKLTTPEWAIRRYFQLGYDAWALPQRQESRKYT